VVAEQALEVLEEEEAQLHGQRQQAEVQVQRQQEPDVLPLQHARHRRANRHPN
jgi:hypothetical protein